MDQDGFYEENETFATDLQYMPGSHAKSDIFREVETNQQ